MTPYDGRHRLSSYNYLVRPNANRRQVTDTTGMTTYGYDALDRLSNVTSPGPTQTQYTYDGNGNRLSTQVDANPAVPYVSDAADQLTSVGAANYASNANGDLTQIGDNTQTFLYDQADRPLRIGPCLGDVNDSGTVNLIDLSTISGAYLQREGNTGYDLNNDMNGDGTIGISDLSIVSAEYNRTCRSTGPATGEGDSVYNGDGLRIRQQTLPAFGSVTDDYVWDQGASLPEVLQDTQTQNGVASTTTHLYGLNGPIAETDGAGATRYYLQDGLGSTTQLTDTSGNVADSYTYDAFGAVTHTGTNPQPFTYAGQQQDVGASRGLVYLRARSYDPALGRFVTQDPLPFMQRYAYADGNAPNLTDPYGLCTWYCVPSPSIQGISNWTKKEIVEPLVNTTQGVANHLGYVDLNGTFCVNGVCGTVGVQASLRDGIHGYKGAGIGDGFGVSLTYAPGQRISTGWFCGFQGSYEFLSGQVGAGSIHVKDKTFNATPFGELGAGISTGLGAYTCAYVG